MDSPSYLWRLFRPPVIVILNSLWRRDRRDGSFSRRKIQSELSGRMQVTHEQANDFYVFSSDVCKGFHQSLITNVIWSCMWITHEQKSGSAVSSSPWLKMTGKEMAKLWLDGKHDICLLYFISYTHVQRSNLQKIAQKNVWMHKLFSWNGHCHETCSMMNNLNLAKEENIRYIQCSYYVSIPRKRFNGFVYGDSRTPNIHIIVAGGNLNFLPALLLLQTRLGGVGLTNQSPAKCFRFF